ncbi:hypothetical protein E0Z10_g132 [Xylaria hypoxylon]|uniref:DNA replication checkpoint mediator MRC1 domain-containing protein n=1 Tax=Xylaria hypoxylon TaxID=37992 RepID=A0A4Z0ZC46_9PEZI|nr:hypothetical protein E0Z10_g132 [Xylaria hypoxylon]
MASTRTSSPAGDASTPTSPQLTPRSKLKAMLAAVDDGSSDDEITGPIDTKSLFAAIDKTKQKLNLKQPSQDDSTDEGDDEDTETLQPRGRVAARMHANFTKADQAAKTSPSTPRRALQDDTPRSTSEHSIVSREPSLVAEADEDDIVAPSRRRLARSNRKSTPETTIQADRHSSPGLFVSPPPQKPTAPSRDSAASDSDSDDVPMDLSKNARFKALVEKKRKARLEKEAEEERKRTEHAQRLSNRIPVDSDADADEDDVSDISDDDGGRKLTQDISRPTRKASKKALEDMNRETQRLSRSLQLAHEAKTKKKISKDTLFKRFNFRAEGSTTEIESKQTSSSRAATPGSAHQTDAELEGDGTPPSSPPSAPKAIPDPPTIAMSTSGRNILMLEDKNRDLPTLENALPQSKNEDKAKGKAVDTGASAVENKQPVTKNPLRRVRVKLPPAQIHTVMTNSDDELEITNPKKKDKLDAVLSRIPENKAQESTGMKIIRNLAHLSSPSKEPARGRNVKPSMTFGELHMSLQQRAKAQAKLERERRLEFLRSKGIVVQSAEERELEREQVEDIVARARQEVEEIMMREREEAKRNRKEKQQNGEADPLAWDDSDDDSFQDDENEEPGEVELSGSGEDEEEDNNDDETVAGFEEDSNNPLFAVEAEEVRSEDKETPKPMPDDFSDEDIETMKRSTVLKPRRPKKNLQVISDDEDEGGVEATPKPKSTYLKSPSVPGSRSPKPPTSVLRSATKSFIPGLPIAAAAPAGLGLTQIFAGTMDDSQAVSFGGSPQDFMPSIDQFPDSQFSATAGQSQSNDMISHSQPTQTAVSQGRETQTQGLQLHYSQSQAHGFDSLIPVNATQMSDFLEPTQDGGFQDFTPLRKRFVDPPESTAGTVLLTSTQDEATIQESPLMRKRGKFLRRAELAASSTTWMSTAVPESPKRVSVVEAGGLSGEKAASSDAFRLLEKAAKREKRLKKKLDKKNSKAIEMIEEQAEESEDEYAGLGGADGEDSSDEDEELIKEMIDDTGNNDGDAAKLAGLFADRERAADAAQVDKLFRDITTGMLRKRRRGGDDHDFDLSDSDDGGEARRRMKRQQFAKMQKALFADERIGKIAENPRNAAFLKSIEDMNDDDELDFDENFAADTKSTSGDDSQSQNASQVDQAIPDSQPPTTGRKRSRTDDHVPRPGPNERRTKDGARPSSIAEVRRSLSTLLDEPNASGGSVVSATEIGSDSDGEGGRPSTSHSNKENRRTRRHNSGAVVDRIALKRNSSSSLSTTSMSTTAKLAFTAPSTAGSGFKVPALLRRATTNSTKLGSNSNPNASGSSSISQASTNGNSGSLNKAASFGEDGKLKKNAGKRSGINYFAHENERRAKVADAEKRREAKKWKGAEGRSKVVGGLFGSGSFE